MSDREKLPELIDRFNSGELSGEELTTFLEMLKSSPRLREEVRLDKELNEVLANEDILELRRKILDIQMKRQQKEGPGLRIFLLAASLLLLLGIETLLFLKYSNLRATRNTGLIHKQQPVSKRAPEITRTEHPVISTDPVKKQKRLNDVKRNNLLAASFKTNPSFETMLGATRYAGNFKLEAPPIGHLFGEKDVVRFEWTMNEDAEIYLKIMNNSGTIVHESGLLSKKTYSLPPGTLKTGLYYFKVMEKEEILFFGKFTVK
jgi:hypothetical protein